MHRFIVPDLDGAISGGTLFNRMLIAALEDSGCHCEVVPLHQAPAVLASAEPSAFYWVDSLFLEDFPALLRAAGGIVPLGLMAHYLPTLVARGSRSGPMPWTAAEATALGKAGAFLVPSAFMRDIVEHFAPAGSPVLHVEPGRLAQGPVRLPDPPVRAVMVANLVPGKGIAPFLEALADELAAGDAIDLTIVGSPSFDPSYAEHCRDIVDARALADRVRFAGALPPEQTLLHMSAGNLLISASVMESYGMALAEARCLGLPIVAARGGNVASFVEPSSGGELVPDARALARACLALARNPREHRLRMAAAARGALPGRPWAMAADDFVAEAAALGPMRSRPPPARETPRRGL